MMYNPQMTTGKPYVGKNSSKSKNYGKFNNNFVTRNNGTRFPRDVLRISSTRRASHSTEKPTELLEYLIRTYTNEGELVLDNCMGSGSTGVACMNTNRQFIGIEIEKEYFDIAKERIEKSI